MADTDLDVAYVKHLYEIIWCFKGWYLNPYSIIHFHMSRANQQVLSVNGVRSSIALSQDCNNVMFCGGGDVIPPIYPQSPQLAILDVIFLNHRSAVYKNDHLVFH